MAAESIYSALMEINEILANNGGIGGGGGTDGSGDGGGSGGGSANNGPISVEISVQFPGDSLVGDPTSVTCNYSPEEIDTLLGEGRVGSFKLSMVANDGTELIGFRGTCVEKAWAANPVDDTDGMISFIMYMPPVARAVIGCDPEEDEWAFTAASEAVIKFERLDKNANVWYKKENPR